MSLRYWVDAFQTAVYLINRLPTSVLKFQSPFETLFGKKPDYSLLKVFGSACFPCTRPYQSHKFQFHSLKCVNLGYNSSHKWYKCLSSIGRIYISRNVTFNEMEFLSKYLCLRKRLLFIIQLGLSSPLCLSLRLCITTRSHQLPL